MEENNSQLINQKEINCTQCGSKLVFAPGVDSLKCTNCGHVNEIKVDQQKRYDALREIDYFRFINETSTVFYQQEEVTALKCQTCGAETSVDANTISTECAFCGAPLVKDQQQITKLIAPAAILPFKIDQKQCGVSFQNWMKKLWFLPNKAKIYCRPEKFQGIYTPYWTYDANTRTSYSGQRGDAYYRTETYTDSSGKSQTRQVREINWTNVSGTVFDDFDDVLILASKNLPEKITKRLKSWNLNDLQPYDKRYMSGFKAESYSIDVKIGYEEAKKIMDEYIYAHIRRDIGGDEQRVFSKNTTYNNVKFKHILLPLWLSTYRYNNKIYRLVVNGQTGEVRGERPYSALKIILFVLLIIAIIAAIVYLTGGAN